MRTLDKKPVRIDLHSTFAHFSVFAAGDPDNPNVDRDFLGLTAYDAGLGKISCVGHIVLSRRQWEEFKELGDSILGINKSRGHVVIHEFSLGRIMEVDHSGRSAVVQLDDPLDGIDRALITEETQGLEVLVEKNGGKLRVGDFVQVRKTRTLPNEYLILQVFPVQADMPV